MFILYILLRCLCQKLNYIFFARFENLMCLRLLLKYPNKLAASLANTFLQLLNYYNVQLQLLNIMIF